MADTSFKYYVVNQIINVYFVIIWRLFILKNKVLEVNNVVSKDSLGYITNHV